MSTPTIHRAELVKIEGAMEILGGLSRPMIYNLVDRGEIQRVHVGRRALITRCSIDAYLDRIKSAGSPEVPRRQ